MLKKIISTLFLLAAMTTVAGATDLGGAYTLTYTPTANTDTFSAKVVIDTAFTSSLYVGDWKKINMRWKVSSATNWADDTIDIVGQYGYYPGATGPWYDIDGFVDEVLIGALGADQDSFTRTTSIVAVRDSFGLWVRAMITHSITVDSGVANDSLGNSYDWLVTPYFDRVDQ